MMLVELTLLCPYTCWSLPGGASCSRSSCPQGQGQKTAAGKVYGPGLWVARLPRRYARHASQNLYTALASSALNNGSVRMYVYSIGRAMPSEQSRCTRVMTGLDPSMARASISMVLFWSQKHQLGRESSHWEIISPHSRVLS
jgi:hypothetical protein